MANPSCHNSLEYEMEERESPTERGMGLVVSWGQSEHLSLRRFISPTTSPT
jgi:hypothetical protein